MVNMFDTSLAQEIWTKKSRFQPVDGSGDEDVQATWRRVAHAVAANDQATQDRLLKDFFLPYLTIRNRMPGYAVSIVKAGAAIVGRSAGLVRGPRPAP